MFSSVRSRRKSAASGWLPAPAAWTEARRRRYASTAITPTSSATIAIAAAGIYPSRATSRRVACSTGRFTGLVRCLRKPASRLCRTSSSMP